jgi:nucleotide-binding universal stress UspA family protein
MRVILVPVANRPECKVALKAACELATGLSANLVGCHVRPHRDEGRRSTSAPFKLVAEGAGSGGCREDQDADLKSRAARDLFARLVEKSGFRLIRRPKKGYDGIALWEEMVGTPAKILSIAGPVSDLVVVSRPKRGKGGPGGAFLLAAMMHAGRPVLVLPERGIGTLGKHVLIGWNQSVDAARAVANALPILSRAESVTIVSSGPENRAGPKARDLQQYLVHWGVPSKKVATKGKDPIREIEQVYRKVQADMLVIGAYSRGHARELVFGGVTEHMIFSTGIPVFALHD